VSNDITNRILYSLANRGLPNPTAGDNVNINIRGTRYGELVTTPLSRWRYTSAAEGSYFFAHNATNDASTTLAGHAAPVLVDADATMTKPFIHLVNNDGTTSSKYCYLDYIEIEVITAGANGTADSWATQIDSGSTRITTPGTALTTGSPNMQSAATPVLAPTGGPIVVGAESTRARQLAHGQFRPSIQIAGDKYTFVFGGEPEGAGATSIATIAHHVVNLPPVILGPSDFFMLALYSPSQSAAGVYKVRMGWMER
jgi:hypothetical protein